MLQQQKKAIEEFQLMCYLTTGCQQWWWGEVRGYEINFGGRACKIDFWVEYDQVQLIWDLSLKGSQEN